MLFVDPAPIPASRRRRRLAEGLERVVASALEPQRTAPCVVLPPRGPVLAERDRLLALARLLRSDEPLPAAFVAGVRAMLVDGCGPLYGGGVGLASALDHLDRLARER